MRIAEDFSRCTCGEAFVYEEKQYLVHKHYEDGGALPLDFDVNGVSVLRQRSVLKCIDCKKERFTIKEQ